MQGDCIHAFTKIIFHLCEFLEMINKYNKLIFFYINNAILFENLLVLLLLLLTDTSSHISVCYSNQVNAFCVKKNIIIKPFTSLK